MQLTFIHRTVGTSAADCSSLMAGGIFVEQARKLVKQLPLVALIILWIPACLLNVAHSTLSNTKNLWGVVFTPCCCFLNLFLYFGKSELFKWRFHLLSALLQCIQSSYINLVSLLLLSAEKDWTSYHCEWWQADLSRKEIYMFITYRISESIAWNIHLCLLL